MPTYDISLALDPQNLQASNSTEFLSTFTISTTHLDAPRLFYENAPSISELDIAKLQGACQVIVIPDRASEVTIKHLEKAIIKPGSGILLKTKNSRLLEESTLHHNYTFISPDAAQYLADRQLAILGFDYFSIDPPGNKWPAHLTLLKQQIPILESIYLEHVPPGTYNLTCLPINIFSAGASPARAMLTKI